MQKLTILVFIVSISKRRYFQLKGKKLYVSRVCHISSYFTGTKRKEHSSRKYIKVDGFASVQYRITFEAQKWFRWTINILHWTPTSVKPPFPLLSAMLGSLQLHKPACHCHAQMFLMWKKNRLDLFIHLKLSPFLLACSRISTLSTKLDVCFGRLLLCLVLLFLSTFGRCLQVLQSR